MQAGAVSKTMLYVLDFIKKRIQTKNLCVFCRLDPYWKQWSRADMTRISVKALHLNPLIRLLLTMYTCDSETAVCV